MEAPEDKQPWDLLPWVPELVIRSMQNSRFSQSTLMGGEHISRLECRQHIQSFLANDHNSCSSNSNCEYLRSARVCQGLGCTEGAPLLVLVLEVLHPRKTLGLDQLCEVMYFLPIIFTEGNSLTGLLSCPELAQLGKAGAKNQIQAVGVQHLCSNH